MSVTSPWLTLTDAAQYLKRGRPFLRREILAGRLRAARVGGKREILTCAEWCDQWVEDQAPVIVPMRRRG